MHAKKVVTDGQTDGFSSLYSRLAAVPVVYRNVA